MDVLPLFHRLAGQPVLVLGEGDAADAKRRLVADAGGEPVDRATEGARLAFLALAEGAEEAAAHWRAQGLLVNVVDRPELCDFTVPAIVDRTPVVAAVGTGGASASLAKALKERLELILPATLGQLALAMDAAKPDVAGVHDSVAARRDFWASLLAPGAALDPLAPPTDPAVAILDALAGSAAPEARLDRIAIGPDGADALRLRELRLMQQADLLLFGPGVPAEALALVRRDATRRPGTEAPDPLEGRVVILTMADA
jgi:uroporphyrin-III C-methyltransferase/precorrin-2 dehydrogenase/sirohydrochlorin ferrochelatase